jgi:predicted transposase/invertase (TIGR01784 family)
MNTRPLVSFDWAIKHLLRDKANFDILEGFLTALLRQELTILSLLESESNQEDRSDKFNHVDLLVENDQHELIIIEVQSNREIHYLERLLYGTSKLIVENLNLGDDYHQIKKVISVSILYFLLAKVKTIMFFMVPQNFTV